MKQLYPDLWQTAEQTELSTLTVHAYLLERPGGNALFYLEAPVVFNRSLISAGSLTTT